MEGRCPHGYRVWIPFDPLGYLLKPKEGACGAHRPVVSTERPSRFNMWREQRRARRMLRNLSTKDFDDGGRAEYGGT
jgi:hypothetical protein